MSARKVDPAIVTLFGSGISVPAGLPNVGCLTTSVLDRDRIKRHSDATYLWDAPPEVLESQTGTRLLAQKLIDHIRHIANYYFGVYEGRKANYEDIYFLIDLLCAEHYSEQENPIVRSFLDNSDILKKYLNVFGEARNLVHDVISSRLHSNCPSTDHMNGLIEGLAGYIRRDLFTLNHDLVLERFFEERGWQYVDGFDRGGDSPWRFSPELFDSGSGGWRVLKLHGGIDWYRLRDGGDWYGDRLYRVCGDQDHQPDGAGGHLSNPDVRSTLLIGSFNKMARYAAAPFLDLHSRFVASLGVASRLLVCGYGFGDKGINAHILAWLYRDRRNGLVVVHPDVRQLLGNARGAIRDKAEEWLEKEIVRAIPKYVQDVTADEVRDALKSVRTGG